MRNGLSQACASVQAGVGLILTTTMLNFVLHVYTFLSYSPEVFTTALNRWILGFSAVQNMVFVTLVVIGIKGAAKCTQDFQNFSRLALDKATRFYLDEPDEFAKYTRFITSISCSPTVSPGYRVFGLLITNATFFSMAFSLLSFILVVVEKLLAQ